MCGATFTATVRRRQNVCSPPCRDARKTLYSRLHQKTDAHSNATNRYRYAVHREPIDRQAIYERDGWRCRLCGRAVSREHRWPDRRAASLDHVLPLSLGGADTPTNVQLAHLGCNLRKSNRVGIVQLRLI